MSDAPRGANVAPAGTHALAVALAVLAGLSAVMAVALSLVGWPFETHDDGIFGLVIVHGCLWGTTVGCAPAAVLMRRGLEGAAPPLQRGLRWALDTCGLPIAAAFGMLIHTSGVFVAAPSWRSWIAIILTALPGAALNSWVGIVLWRVNRAVEDHAIAVPAQDVHAPTSGAVADSDDARRRYRIERRLRLCLKIDALSGVVGFLVMVGLVAFLAFETANDDEGQSALDMAIILGTVIGGCGGTAFLGVGAWRLHRAGDRADERAVALTIASIGWLMFCAWFAATLIGLAVLLLWVMPGRMHPAVALSFFAITGLVLLALAWMLALHWQLRTVGLRQLGSDIAEPPDVDD